MNQQERLKDVILYLLDKFKSIDDKYNGKKKLAKLLYFIDFYYYKDTGHTIGSDSYMARKMGPVPSEFYPVLQALVEDGVITQENKTITYGDKTYSQEINKIVRLLDLNLDKKEKDFIDKVFNKFKFKTALDLEEISHSQAPWNSVDENEIIPLSTAFLLPDLNDIK